MKLIVDRIEGENIICEKEDRSMITIKRVNVEGTVKEGDCLEVCNEKIIIDENEKKRISDEINELCEDMWE